MEGAFFSSRTKRRFGDLDGAPWWHRKTAPPPLTVSDGDIAFRLLCPTSHIGGVIGKSGAVVKLIRQETSARIRVEDSVPECAEGIVVIVASVNPKKSITLNDGTEYEASPAQDALIRVFDRILEIDKEIEGEKSFVCCRLLAVTNHVGSVMGIGGKNIEKIRKESGSRLRVLPPEQLPISASPLDEVIQITGAPLAVKKALLSVSSCLQEIPPTDKSKAFINARPYPKELYPDTYGDSILHRQPMISPDPLPRKRLAPADIRLTSGEDGKKMHQEVSFKLLCSSERVNGIIGKNGIIVRALEKDTGASIRVGASIPDSEERVITISALEGPEPYSPAQMALIRVYIRSMEVGFERGLEPHPGHRTQLCARLLVPSNHIGCLMGKGGAIIEEMRKVTGTGIRIISGNEVPKCAAENEEVVQINGEFEAIKDALFHVADRLRENIFPSKKFDRLDPMPEATEFGRLGHPHSPGLYPSRPRMYSSSLTETTPYDRYKDSSPALRYLSGGLARDFDTYADARDTGLPLSPRLPTSQNVSRTVPRGTTDGWEFSATSGSDLARGNKSAIVTNTTVEIVVPESSFGSVYGENGTNLNKIRQISGAKVVVQDPRAGGSGMVIISGTPDQTQAAQSLLQAFILSGP